MKSTSVWAYVKLTRVKVWLVNVIVMPCVSRQGAVVSPCGCYRPKWECLIVPWRRDKYDKQITNVRNPNIPFETHTMLVAACIYFVLSVCTWIYYYYVLFTTLLFVQFSEYNDTCVLTCIQSFSLLDYISIIIHVLLHILESTCSHGSL